MNGLAFRIADFWNIMSGILNAIHILCSWFRHTSYVSSYYNSYYTKL